MELWTSSWGPWEDHARQWWEGASEEDQHHVACLRVPKSFLEGIPPEGLPFLRARVARHQYQMLLGVHLSCSRAPSPSKPSCIAPSISKYGSLVRPDAQIVALHAHCA